MSNSPEITIKSSALREAVESALNIWAIDTEWETCERLAREKLQRLRAASPEVSYYDNKYLVSLAVEIYRYRRQAAAINADARKKLAERKLQNAKTD